MPLSLGAAIRARSEENPGRPAVTLVRADGGTSSCTRAELESRTNRLARTYQRMGVGYGDFVTIALPNSITCIEAAIAAWKVGAVPQPVSHRLPAVERQAIIDLARPALVVGGEASGRRHLAEGFKVPDEVDDDPLPDVIAPHRLAVTSGGSTGLPKLIVSGRRGETASADFVDQGCDSVLMIPGPLYHNGPLSNALDGVCAGNHVVVAERFDPVATLSAVESYRAEWMLLVPTMMLRIWRLPAELREKFDLSSLRTVWHMAAPCPEWLKQAWIDWLGPERVWEMFTATEAQAGTAIRGDDWLRHRGSVGKVLWGEMMIADPMTGVPLLPDSIGEIYLRRPKDAPPSYEYVGAEARQLSGGWESLGDMGRFDADGYLYLADRKADMILSGGANVYPAEVEAAIMMHPGVLSCAVIGLPDEDLGSRVHAIVQVDRSGVLAPERLRRFLREQIVSYKIPKSFEFVEWTVRDDAGKVRRSLLQRERIVHIDSIDSAGEDPRIGIVE